jgi:hypothetical protein
LAWLEVQAEKYLSPKWPYLLKNRTRLIEHQLSIREVHTQNRTGPQESFLKDRFTTPNTFLAVIPASVPLRRGELSWPSWAERRNPFGSFLCALAFLR